jgi:IclR family acetate operon transcriptional repressor
MNNPYQGTQAVLRAISVLQAVGSAPGPRSPQELSRGTGLNRSTIYRLLSALEDEGFVVADASGRFRLGPALIALGGLALRQIDLRELALPHLRELARQSGETVDLEVLSGSNVLIIEEVTGDHLLTTSGNIGRTYPARRASTGKALLASLPPGQLAAALGLPPTASVDTSDPAFAQELALARERGYATSYEELEAHLHAIGAAILDHTGAAIAAISVSGPAARLMREREREIALLVRQTCALISGELGYRTMDDGR